jgi:hypothetical protein
MRNYPDNKNMLSQKAETACIGSGNINSQINVRYKGKTEDAENKCADAYAAEY